MFMEYVLKMRSIALLKKHYVIDIINVSTYFKLPWRTVGTREPSQQRDLAANAVAWSRPAPWGSFSTCKIMAWFPYLVLFEFPSEKDIPSSRTAIKECSKLSNTHSDQTEPFRECKRFPETFCIFPILDFRENRISSNIFQFWGEGCVYHTEVSQFCTFQ